MYKKIALVLCLLASLSVHAQSIADMWINCPEQLTPYLTKNDRKEMIECRNIGVDTKVTNKLKETSDIVTLADDYGCFMLSDAKDLQILRLPTENDSIYLCIETVKLPECQSTVRFYDKTWKPLANEGKISDIPEEAFWAKPDTMTMERFIELKHLISLVFVEYRYSPELQALIVQPNIAFVTEEEKEHINALISKKILKWTGAMFN